ncbi:E3 ubiquitin-protein ligase TRIP12 [Metschnikowia aff. pulcherrima]|uniref:HECT-type E3 ubiquitin transferase n=2 Tax=Metschnikowia TaxID=27320 RepID=A0A4P6XNN5_9ASCO|nr:E3 ubiquitin-protein ligase TRIP12 [Metschnikowia aff. pulcherrima]
MATNNKREKPISRKRGIVSHHEPIQILTQTNGPALAATSTNSQNDASSEAELFALLSQDEDEAMHDYANAFSVLHSSPDESGGVIMGSDEANMESDDGHGAYGDYDDESGVHEDDSGFHADTGIRDDDSVDFDESRSRDIEGESEIDDDDDEDEDGDDTNDDENVEDDEDDMGALYGFMSGSGRGSGLLRDLVERNRQQSGTAPRLNLLDVMQRLVDGFEGPAFGRQHLEIDALIGNISQRDDTYLIMESINEISDKMLMMDGMTAERVIQPGSLAQALVDVLTDPLLADDLELHLVTCRCLYNFVEVNTDFVHDALSASAVEILVEKLLDIVYIDLTEQCLQTLEIMSRDRGAHSLIVGSDGLRACLQNLDFLTVHSQRKCLQIVANACEDILAVYFDFVLAQFENLVHVAEHHNDTQVKKSAWLGVSRIINSFKEKPDFMERLFSNDELLCHMLSVIRDSCNPSSTDVGLNYHSMISLLKSLIILISSSVRISNLLLNLGVGEYIKGSLNKFKKSDDGKHPDDISIESLISCPKELLSLFLNVIAYLSPITYSPKETPFLPDKYKVSQVKNRINYDRNTLYRNENAEPFRSFLHHVWPVLIGSFQATMDYSVRKQVLICITRMVAFAGPESIGKKGLESLYGILTSIVSSGKKAVFKAVDVSSVTEASVNGPILLLLSACVIIHNLLLKSQLTCAHVLEREGIFSELAQITEALTAAGISRAEERSEEPIANESPLTNTFQERFADKELVDFTQHTNSRSSLTYLFTITAAVSHLYDDFTLLSDTYAPDNDKLQPIVIALKKATKESTNDSNAWSSIWCDLANALSVTEGGMSSFELSSLGLLSQLVDVFQDSVLSEESRRAARATFIATFSSEESNLANLVSLLQDSLSRAESFEVISSGIANSGGGECGSNSLAKQIRLRLIPRNQPNQDAHVKADQMVVSVHAIATFKTIESFLKQRSFFSDSSRERNGLGDDSSHPDSSEHSEIAQQIVLSVRGSEVSKDSTVFGAIFKSVRATSGARKVEGHDIWGKPHEVHYSVGPQSESLQKHLEEADLQDVDAQTESILHLLSVLFRMNEEVRRSNTQYAIPIEVFMNWKLTVKLNRQLEEPLIVASGSMPTWSITTTTNFSFLYPLNTRVFFMQSTSFGHSRLIHNWNNRAIKDKSGSSNESTLTTSGANLLLGAPARKKVRLARDKIFKSAIKILQQFGLQPPILEMEYFDEVGSGLGPTLEFYASVSKAFCKTELGMWRHNSIDEEYADSSQGLFPAPINVQKLDPKNKNILFYFRMLGVFVARALLDYRIMDFNFNPLFISLIQDPRSLDDILGEKAEITTQLELLRGVDADLARSLKHLTKYLDVYCGNSQDRLVEVDGMQLSDLSLYFNVPGHEKLNLVQDGGNIEVTSENLEVYVRKSTEFLLVSGVAKQVTAFREGFSSVFPIESLNIFTPQELREIFGSGEEDWSRETISDSIKANHGYTQDSKAIVMLVNVLQDLNLSERREFLQFLTGSPRLPIGGFKAMRPEFTVVRKHPDAGLSSDDYLPSVMTCANYLKLPDYALETLLRSKLLHAIREGAGAFHLS